MFHNQSNVDTGFKSTVNGHLGQQFQIHILYITILNNTEQYCYLCTLAITKDHKFYIFHFIIFSHVHKSFIAIKVNIVPFTKLSDHFPNINP